MKFLAVVSSAILLQFVAAFPIAAQSEQEKVESLSQNDIFQRSKIWTIHLALTAENWKQMEPKQAGRPQFGRGRGSFLQGPEGSRNGIASAFGFVFAYVPADLEFDTLRLQNVGVRYKGNGTFLSSQDKLKKSIKIDVSQFEKKHRLAGMKQINLHNSVRDPSGMNESIAYQLFRDGGVPAPRTAHAKVFITVPGAHERKYVGLYNLVEDVDSSFLRSQFDSSEGAILKPVTPDLFSDLGDDWKNYNQTYDPKGSLSDSQKQRIIEFCKFSSSASDEQFAEKLGDFIDLENVARYMAITAWLSDLDGILGPGQNYYLHLHPESNKFAFIPWDQDQVFGQFPRGSQEQRENLNIRKPWTGENRFLSRVFKCESFQRLYLEKMKLFNTTIFQPKPIQQKVDELAELISTSVHEESAERQVEFDKAVNGQPFQIAMGPGFPGKSSIVPIKPFVQARHNSVKKQLDGENR